MEAKKPWYSKTMWINGILGLAAAAAIFLPAASQVKVFFDAYAAQIAMGWSVLNMVLRAISKDKIQLGE